MTAASGVNWWIMVVHKIIFHIANSTSGILLYSKKRKFYNSQKLWINIYDIHCLHQSKIIHRENPKLHFAHKTIVDNRHLWWMHSPSAGCADLNHVHSQPNDQHTSLGGHATPLPLMNPSILGCYATSLPLSSAIWPIMWKRNIIHKTGSRYCTFIGGGPYGHI